MPVRGSAGGRATLQKHGVEHFRKLGKAGFQSFCERYFSGDREAATSWLHRRAATKLADSHADRILQERIDAGEKVACQELPVYEDDESVPF